MFFDNQNDLNEVISTLSNNDSNLINPSIGLQKGNMFNKEYKPYKNIEPKKIESTNDESNLLLKIYELDFAIIDTALYLDLHKNDIQTYITFQDYVNKYNKYKEKYEQEYNILYQDNIINDKYSWTNDPWPKDNNGGIKYV